MRAHATRKKNISGWSIYIHTYTYIGVYIYIYNPDHIGDIRSADIDRASCQADPINDVNLLQSRCTELTYLFVFVREQTIHDSKNFTLVFAPLPVFRTVAT